MIHSRTNQILLKIASTLYIILFVYAASSKFFGFDGFRIQLGQSPIVTAYADWVAWGIPILELVIVLLFIIPRCMLLAFYASFSLMVMFTTYIVLVLNFSDFVPCSCGGVLEDLGWTEHIVFNLAFVAIAAIGVVISSKQPTINSITA